MTQANIPLLTGPVNVATLGQTLYNLTLAINASGIGSAPIVPPPQPLRRSFLGSLNDFILSINAVTAAGTVALLARPISPNDLRNIVNAIILQVNAFVGGGSSYIAKAIHLDGVTSLNIASLTSTDNTLFSAVGWIKQSNAEASLHTDLIVSDPNGNYSTYMGFRNTVDPQLMNLYKLQVADAAYNNSATFTGPTIGTGYFPTDAWNCIIICMDTSDPNVGDYYINGVRQVAFTDDGNATFPFTIATNGLMLSFGVGCVGDFADWRIMPGLSLLNGGGVIPPATVSLFIDANGKPVDPAVATLALGAPCMLFSGDATTFGGNQGIGGAFTLTGTLTNASTSPSDGGGADNLLTLSGNQVLTISENEVMVS